MTQMQYRYKDICLRKAWQVTGVIRGGRDNFNTFTIALENAADAATGCKATQST